MNFSRIIPRCKRAVSCAWRPASAALGSAWAGYALLGTAGAALVSPALLWLSLSMASAKVPPSSPQRRMATAGVCVAAGMIAAYVGPAWLAGFALIALGLSMDLGFAALPMTADLTLLALMGLAAMDSFSSLTGSAAAAANALCAIGSGYLARAHARQSFKIDPAGAALSALTGLAAFLYAPDEPNLLFSAFCSALFIFFCTAGLKQLAAQLKNGSSNALSQSISGVKASAEKIADAAQPTAQETSQAESEILASELDDKAAEAQKEAKPASRKSL